MASVRPASSAQLYSLNAIGALRLVDPRTDEPVERMSLVGRTNP